MPATEPAFWPEVLASCETEIRAYLDHRTPPSLRAVLSSDDVLQQALTDCVRRPPPSTDPRVIKEWLWRTVRSTLIDMVRAARRTKRGGRVRFTWFGLRVRPNPDLAQRFRAPGRTPSDELLAAESQEALRRALDRLPPACRWAVEQHHLRGCPVQEVARSMGRSPGAVRGLLKRGMQALRAHFKRYGARESR